MARLDYPGRAQVFLDGMRFECDVVDVQYEQDFDGRVRGHVRLETPLPPERGRRALLGCKGYSVIETTVELSLAEVLAWRDEAATLETQAAFDRWMAREGAL